MRKVEKSEWYGDASRLLLGADTIVVADNRVFGKPIGPVSAERMLNALSGRSHDVITGICFAGPAMQENASTKLYFTAVKSRVKFRRLETFEFKSYLASKEWEGKAGAYAIQGAAGEEYCIITAEAVTDTDGTKVPFVNLYAMSMMGVGVMA